MTKKKHRRDLLPQQGSYVAPLWKDASPASKALPPQLEKSSYAYMFMSVSAVVQKLFRRITFLSRSGEHWIMGRAQSGEHWIAELTGSESPVRAASALAVCSWLGLSTVGGNGRAQGKLTSVERGGPCPAMWAR